MRNFSAQAKSVIPTKFQLIQKISRSVYASKNLCLCGNQKLVINGSDDFIYKLCQV